MDVFNLKYRFFYKIQINNLVYMNLQNNLVLVKLNQNKVEETFILKLKILSFYSIFKY